MVISCGPEMMDPPDKDGGRENNSCSHSDARDAMETQNSASIGQVQPYADMQRGGSIAVSIAFPPTEQMLGSFQSRFSSRSTAWIQISITDLITLGKC